MSIEDTKSITDTFVCVSADCSVEYSMVPVGKKETKSIHQIQYELLTERPYYYTHEELIYQVYLIHKVSRQMILKFLLKAYVSSFSPNRMHVSGHPCFQSSMDGARIMILRTNCPLWHGISRICPIS